MDYVSPQESTLAVHQTHQLILPDDSWLASIKAYQYFLREAPDSPASVLRHHRKCSERPSGGCKKKKIGPGRK